MLLYCVLLVNWVFGVHILSPLGKCCDVIHKRWETVRRSIVRQRNTLKPTPWKEEEKIHLRVYKKNMLTSDLTCPGSDDFGFQPGAARFESCPGHLPS